LKIKATNCGRPPQAPLARRNAAVSLHGKNSFVTATKFGTTNKFFVAATKNFAAETQRFVD